MSWVTVNFISITQSREHLDVAKAKSYVQDLRSLLENADLVQSKPFLRSFIRRIEINERQVVICYNLPLPSNYGRKESVEVLPIVTRGGAGVSIGRNFSANVGLSGQFPNSCLKGNN